MPSGACTTTPGYEPADNEKMTNAKFRALGTPVVRVGEGAITSRELDGESARGLLGTSRDYVPGIFADGGITVGSTTFTSVLAVFDALDVGRRVVAAGVPAGATIASISDAQTAILSVPAAMGYDDGVVDATSLVSQIAAFTANDQGRTIVGPNFAPGTTIDAVVSATEVTLNQAAQNGSALSFQINGRTASGVRFMIVGRGIGWKFYVDAAGIGRLEMYVGVFCGTLAVGQFQVDTDGSLSIGAGDNMLRAEADGTFRWGFNTEVLGINSAGKLFAGGRRYEDAPTKIGSNGDVTILDQASSGHLIQTGVVDPTVGDVTMNPSGGAITTNPTPVELACPTHYSAIYYRKALLDGVSNSDSSFVSASAAFTVLDVGKLIAASNIPAGTRIKSVTNGTTIVLTANTTSTTTGIEFYIVPDITDTLYVDGTPISLTAGTKIAARAYKGGHYSALNTKVFTVDTDTVPNPTFAPVPGVYGGGSLVVTLACALSGSKIRYTLDGTTTPTTSTGTLIDAATGTVTLPQGTTTIKAIAYKAGVTNPSAVVTKVYTVNAGSGLSKVATPTFSPGGFTSPNHAAQSVTIATTSTTNIRIRYTIDGTTPTQTHGTLITGNSGSATVPQHVATTLKAIAYKTDGTLLDSDLKSALYDFTPSGSGGGGSGGGGGGGGGHNLN